MSADRPSTPIETRHVKPGGTMRPTPALAALTLTLMLAALDAGASERCPDDARRLLLMQQAPRIGDGGVGDEALTGCLLDLSRDVSAISGRIKTEAKEKATEDKRVQVLTKLAEDMRAAVSVPNKIQAEKVKELAGKIQEAAREIDTFSVCTDPERQAALVASLGMRLTSLKASLESDGLTRAAQSVADGLEEITRASKCDSWALVIPDAPSQLESTGPGDAPIDEYLLDAKAA